MTPAEKIGANLRRARKGAGISQEECAFRADLHRTQMSLYETGRYVPRTLTLVRLAGSVGVTPNDLLAGLEWAPGTYEFGRMTIGEDDS
jgi:transcriptional regulator with XRE-family HTH domain